MIHATSRIKRFALYLVLSFAVARCHASSADAVVARPACGPVTGISAGDLHTFKGIPYALPPVGDLRFAPPRNIEPWSEVLKCDTFGPSAVQTDTVRIADGSELPMSEDCLTLNVWKPAGSEAGDKLPVLVYFHGGSYARGGGAWMFYDGGSMARRGMVVVTFNSRLNLLGFLASRETLKQYGTTGNWGHLDQIKVLEWVRDNIQAFGGDSGNVTLAGSSTGASGVSAMILSPLAKGLFHSAILESGSILSIPTNTVYARGDLEHGMDMGGRILGDALGVSDDADGLAELRRIEPGVFAQLSAVNGDFTQSNFFTTYPVFDGVVLPRDPVRALRTGEFNKVNILFGLNTNEGMHFIPANVNRDHYVMLAHRLMGGRKRAEAVLKRFPMDKEHSAATRAANLISHCMFFANTKRFVDAATAHGIESYAYRFDYPSADGIRGKHGTEIPFLFGNFGAFGISDPSTEDLALSAEISTRWANFIKNGNPNIGDSTPSGVSWPKYDISNPEVIRLDTEITVESFPFRDDIEFMEKLLYEQDE